MLKDNILYHLMYTLNYSLEEVYNYIIKRNIQNNISLHKEIDEFFQRSSLHSYHLFKFCKECLGRCEYFEDKLSFGYYHKYAREVIKGKLPEEMHNRALVAHLNNPFEVEKYFNYLKTLDTK